MQKYYYHQGRCPESHYMSLVPIRYQSTETKGEYQKEEMVCHGWENGRAILPSCPHSKDCVLLKEAPDILQDVGTILRDKLIGE